MDIVVQVLQRNARGAGFQQTRQACAHQRKYTYAGEDDHQQTHFYAILSRHRLNTLVLTTISQGIAQKLSQTMPDPGHADVIFVTLLSEGERFQESRN